MGAGAFWGGIKYEQKQPSEDNFQTMRGMRQSGTMPAALHRQGEGSGMIRGEIISQDEEGIIVKLADDSSKIILISENTKINKATEATPDDLVIGEQIMVFGQTNSDGSISATQIQLDFEMGRGQ